MLDRAGAALVPTFWWLVEQVTHETVVYSDATGWNVGGQRAVVWVFTTFRATVYWIDPKGSGMVPLTVLGEAIDGAVVTDSAERFQYVAHRDDPRCLAHPLRTARDLLAAYPGRSEIVSMMTALRDQLSLLIALYPYAVLDPHR